MGQYRQWLSYQERERRLKAELAALEAELAQLEAALDTHFLEQLNQPANSLTQTLLIQALFHFTSLPANTSASPSHSISDQQVCAQEEIATSTPPLTNGYSESPRPVETGSSVLFSWGPDLGLPDLENPEQLPANSSPFSSEADLEFLPEDMQAFIEGHSETDPQIELPRWLRRITVTSGESDITRPIDQESIRNNRLVQRWARRWGRPSSTSPTIAPDQKSEDAHDE
ncbi:MAG TPA: hypothetical protein VFA41_19345 [Ktedonobacteraceae bacterium]|jgi:hypothetical protein|nr:hypothetical protein [Ktedonobacteraceae bacterium]